MKNNITKLCLLAATAMLSLLAVTVFENPTEAQSTPLVQSAEQRSAGDLTLTSLNVYPNSINNPTNVGTFWDSTGTNFVRLTPTNGAQLQLQLTGTNWVGQTTNVLATLTNVGNRTLVFINGLLVKVQ